MRRSLGGLLLLVAAALFTIAVGTFALERVAFSPDPDTDAAYEVLADEDIRGQIASLVASVDGPELGISPSDLRLSVEQIARLHPGAAEMRHIVAAAHEVLIGDRDEAAVITAAEQVQIVRNENVALMPDITLPVETVGAFEALAGITRWAWMITGGLAVFLTLVGLFFRPERGEFTFAFSVGCVASGLSVLVFGYLVPSFLLPALTDDVWGNLFPRLAAHNRTMTLAVALAFIAVGAATFFATSGLRQRRQRTSTPLAVGRYRETHSWSR